MYNMQLTVQLLLKLQIFQELNIAVAILYKMETFFCDMHDMLDRIYSDTQEQDGQGMLKKSDQRILQLQYFVLETFFSPIYMIGWKHLNIPKYTRVVWTGHCILNESDQRNLHNFQRLRQLSSDVNLVTRNIYYLRNGNVS